MLNKACRDKDETKVGTLGPFAYCLSLILQNAQQRRKEEDQVPSATILYRGIKMPIQYAGDLQKYTERIGKIYYLN